MALATEAGQVLNHGSTGLPQTNSEAMEFVRSDALRSKSHALIPGGSHTYAKGDDQFPVTSPGFIIRGAGCHVWDVDNNEFIEYGMGLRAVTLGHGYRPVVEAAYRAMQMGTNFGRPSLLEVECAERIVELFEAAEMVKFAKNGSDVTSAAVKLARAFTSRDMVAVCADQPFFSTDDWFIGSTPMDAGVPRSTRELTVKFRYNDLESIRNLFADHPGQVACLILEPVTVVEPRHDFLQAALELCHENGALLILDAKPGLLPVESAIRLAAVVPATVASQVAEQDSVWQAVAGDWIDRVTDFLCAFVDYESLPTERNHFRHEREPV